MPSAPLALSCTLMYSYKMKNPKDKQREYSKRHYARNKKAIIAKKVKRQAEIREHIRLSKAGPCMDCGNSFPPFVMDYDHRDPSAKSMSLADAPKSGWSNKRLEEEIAKCDLVCANCHRIRTWKTSPLGEQAGSTSMMYRRCRGHRFNALRPVNCSLSNLSRRQTHYGEEPRDRRLGAGGHRPLIPRT